MAATPKVLARALPTVTSATTATVPTGFRWIVTNIVIQNTAATTATGTITLNGVTLAIVTLASQQQYVLDCRQVLDASQALGYTSSVASTLAFHISGIEQGL